MAIIDAIPFGMRDLKVTPYLDEAGTVLGTTSYDLPYMQTLTFNETEDFTEMRGDDKLVTTHGAGAMVDWSLEAGGISLVIWSIFSGGSLIVSGMSPNRKEIMRKRVSDVRPWSRLDGQIMSDTGGDIVARIYRARCTDSIGGDFGDQAFYTTGASGVGYGLLDDTNDILYDLIRNETKSTLALTPEPNPLQSPQNLTPSAVTAAGVTLTWSAVVGAETYRVQRSTDAGVTWTDVAGDVTAPTVTKAITGLTASTAYRFRVASIIDDVLSNYSASVSITTAAS